MSIKGSKEALVVLSLLEGIFPKGLYERISGGKVAWVVKDVKPGATERVIFSVRDQFGFHWISFNVAATGQQLFCFLNGLGFETPLPKMAGTLVGFVVVMNVREVDPGHNLRKHLGLRKF